MATKRSDYKNLLTPRDSTIILLNSQPELLSGIMSMDRQQLLSNTIALAKIAKIFAVPIILSVVETEHLSGRLFPELETLIPEENLIAHSTTNPWEVPAFVEAVKDVGQSRLLMAGVWTDVS